MLSGPLGAQTSLTTDEDIESGGRLVSKATAGPPLEVSSNDRVVGLNADLVDGLQAASFALGVDLSAVADRVSALESTIADQQELIGRLHPKLRLEEGRFRAWVTFEDEGGTTRAADPVPVGQTTTNGYFYFTRSFYPDVYVRILDARVIDDRWWIAATSLTDLEYRLTVVDRATGETEVYVNPSGSRSSFFDTSSFPDPGGYPLRLQPERLQERPSGDPARRRPAGGTASCTSDADTLCLVDDRFLVEASYAHDGASGDATVNTDLVLSHAGALGFFDPSTIDLVVKVVEKPTQFEVAIGSLTDVEYTVTVTDTCTSTSALYESVDGSLDNFGDDTTFPNVPC